MVKKYTSIEIAKISNGWLIEMNWEEKENRPEGKDGEINYGEDRIYCSSQGEALVNIREGMELFK